MATPAPGKPQEKTPLSWWIMLLVGAPLVLTVSVFTGRKFATALVGGPPQAKQSSSLPVPAETLEGETVNEDVEFVPDTMVQPGEDRRFVVQQAIDAARARRRQTAGEQASEEKTAPPAEETAEPEPGDTETTVDDPSADPFSDFPDGPVGDINPRPDSGLGDGDFEEGDFPSSIPPKGSAGEPPRDYPLPKPPAGGGAPKDDFDDLVEDGGENTPSFMGNPPAPAPKNPYAPSPAPKPPPVETDPFEEGPGSSKAPGDKYTVQVANFKNKSSADALKQELAGRGYKADVQPVSQGGEAFYKVKVGKFESKAKAEETAKNLQLQNYTGFVQEE